MKFEVNARMLALVLMRFLKMIPRQTKSATAVILLKLAVSWDGILQVLAVNDNVKLRAALPVSVEVPGSLCIPPKALVDLVKSIAQPGRSIHVENEDLAHQLKLSAGSVRHVLTSSPGDCLEDTGVDEEPLTTIQIPVTALKQALYHLCPVQSLDPKGGSVTDTCLDLDETGTVSMVTTDSYRLAIVHVPETKVSGMTKAQSWVFRNLDLQLVASVMSGKNTKNDSVTLEQGATTWTAAWGPYKFTAPFSKQRFPNWRSIRPRDYANSLVVNSAELIDRLNVAITLGEKKSAKVRFRWNGSSECILAAGNKELGAESAMPLALTWQYREALPDSELVMDARLLEPLISRMKGQVEFKFTAPALPAMVRPLDGETCLEYLVMPINT